MNRMRGLMPDGVDRWKNRCIRIEPGAALRETTAHENVNPHPANDDEFSSRSKKGFEKGVGSDLCEALLGPFHTIEQVPAGRADRPGIS